MSRGRWLYLPGGRDLAAAWWSASLRARTPIGLLARCSPPIAYAGAGLVMAVGSGGCAALLSDNEESSMQEALEAQREQGWTAGEPGVLLFSDAQDTDGAGSTDWRGALEALASRLAPSEPRWLPYYDPTLFQALQAPRNADLRLMMRPVYSPAMALAARRGEAMLSLFTDGGGCRNDVALVLDVSGPEAVALAAALAPCFDPVFVFDNWPHPRGVVPSHQTLGAALYYLPWFERARAGRTADAAPAFVVDRQRLVPYTDDGARFDNRYLAGLPPRDALVAAGIRHVLYVMPDDRAQSEADDLNDDLVDLDQSGIDVRLLALSDFSETPPPGWPDDPPPPEDFPAPSFDPTPPSVRIYFGGSAHSHACFWDWYGWPGPRHVLQAGTRPPPPPLASRVRYRPVLRQTFSWGLHGAHPGRSGSLGRSHFGHLSG